MREPKNRDVEMTAKVDYAHFTWAGGTHRFSLTPCNEHRAGVMRTRDTCSALLEPLSLGPLYKRLTTFGWSRADIRATIRDGLLSSWPGYTKDAAPQVEALLKQHVDGQPVAPSLVLAQAIVSVAMFGVDKKLADKPSAPPDVTSVAA